MIHKLAIAATLSAIALAASAQSSTAAPQADSPTDTRSAAPSDSDVVKAAYKRADANADGKLTREEAASLPAVAQKFDQLDTNHDGVLDANEFETGVAAGQPAK